MSAILSAEDLNDFISPGVACIKPVETLPLQDPQKQDVRSSPLVLALLKLIEGRMHMKSQPKKRSPNRVILQRKSP